MQTSTSRKPFTTRRRRFDSDVTPEQAAQAKADRRAAEIAKADELIAAGRESYQVATSDEPATERQIDYITSLREARTHLLDEPVMTVEDAVEVVDARTAALLVLTEERGRAAHAADLAGLDKARASQMIEELKAWH